MSAQETVHTLQEEALTLTQRLERIRKLLDASEAAELRARAAVIRGRSAPAEVKATLKEADELHSEAAGLEAAIAVVNEELTEAQHAARAERVTAALNERQTALEELCRLAPEVDALVVHLEEKLRELVKVYQVGEALAEEVHRAGTDVPPWGRAQEVTGIVAARVQAAGALPVNLPNVFARGTSVSEAIGLKGGES